MKKVVLILFLLLIAVSMIGMATNSDTIIEESIGSVPTLDPGWSYDTTSGEVIYQMYDNLIQYDRESTSKFLPMISTNVPSVKDGTILDGGKTFVFHIRQNVSFHNGDILTPQDVVYSLERSVIFDRSGGPSWMLTEALMPRINGSYVDSITEWAIKLAGVKSYDDLFVEGTKTPKNERYRRALINAYNILDEAFEIKGNTVIIHLPHVYPPFMYVLTHSRRSSSILDKKWASENGAWDGKANTWWNYHNPTREKDPLYSIENGSGPFMLERWTRGREIVFKRFDNYWAGPAKIKYAIIKRVQEFTTRKLDLMRGNADIIYVPIQYLVQVDKIPNVSVYNYPTFLINAVHMTWDISTNGNPYVGSAKLDGNGIPSNFFADKNVRMGFAYLFAYKKYIDQAWYGKATTPNGALAKGMIGYNPKVPAPFDQDLQKATEYFKKAFNGKLWDEGFKFTAVYNTGNAQRKTALEIISAYARKINPKFKIRIVGELWSAFLSDFQSQKLPMYLLGWVSDYPDPYNLAWTYYGSTGVFGSALGNAYVKWAQKHTDPLLTESMKTLDPQKRQEIYEQLNTISHDNAIYIFTTQPDGLQVQRSDVQGWFYNSVRPGQDFYYLSKK